MKISASCLIVCAFAAPGVQAQSEAELKRFFEGKHVTVRMDMPGTHHGVDIYPEREPKADMQKYSSRLKQYGVSLREGDRVMVTTVHVTKKNIEFQLAGGGYGAWGDSNGLPTVPSSSTPKSSRERRLEGELSRASESDKRRIRDELDRERRDRQRADRYARERSASVQIERERMIRERRRDGGSRFNIWFQEGRLQESVPMPEDVMRVLADYADFRELRVSGPARPSPQRTQAAQPASPPRLERGMSRAQVHSLLGRPVSSRQSRQGDLNATVDRFQNGQTATEVTFVNDVLVSVR